jgi:uncharacterized YigZ family protein
VYTVTKTAVSDYRVKGSEFLGYLFPCKDVKKADKLLQKVRSEHHTATHHCYAYALDPHDKTEFSSDDGEPGGTAGLPIQNILRSYDMINVMLIVVRYYGGTKLGKAGLIDAYSHTAKLTAETAVLKEVLPVKTFKIIYDYPQQGAIDKLKNDFTLIELDSSYLQHVELNIGVPVSESGIFESKLMSLAHLFDEIEDTGKGYHIVE